MKVEQGWLTSIEGTPALSADARLVFAFGPTDGSQAESALSHIRDLYPEAEVVGCTTAGSILDTRVEDVGMAVTAIAFGSTRVRTACVSLDECDSFAAGKRLGEELADPGLRHVLVISDGLAVNGSELVAGLNAALPACVGISGGLAADADRFEETYVFSNSGAGRNKVVALGIYGDRIDVGCGSLGGWDPFGPYRQVTRSRGNVLFELDGKSALQLYKRYLGDEADGLPGSGLKFPLSIRANEGDHGIVRTILSINEEEQSLTFAGDIPEGSYAQLMKANFDRLIDGAVGAARAATTAVRAQDVQLALLISCVGRRMVLKQRVEEEVEGVRDVLSPSATLTGFYSYGEISPFTPDARCELHNQTMTITTFAEHDA